MRGMVAQARADLDRELRISNRGRQLALLTHHLAVLLSAGVPLVQCIDVLEGQAEDGNLAQALESIGIKVRTGHRFSHALSQFPRIFPPVFTGLIAVGENTGALVEAIRQLSRVLEKEDRLNRQVRGAVAYPGFILVLTGTLTLIMFRFVLPTFVEMFQGSGAVLPLPTRIVLLCTKLSGSVPFWLISIALILLIVRQLKAWWEIPARRLIMYRLILMLPWLGQIVRYATLARYCWVMQLTLRAGLDFLRCLQLAALASNSPIIEDDMAHAQASIRFGETFSKHVSDHDEIYPRLLLQFVLLGEEATELSSAFGHAAAWFEEEVEFRVELFKAALEPIMMVGVSLIVGGIVLSIFLPLYGLLDKL